MPLYYGGELVSGPRGPAGPDGNPVGTVISFMGTAAPKDYLICDGAEHSVKDYPALAEFFREQFGAANHFGGDGEAIFAVPDMRNLFLRGFRGEAEETLSGEVGERQEATEHVRMFSNQLNIIVPCYDNTENYDEENMDSACENDVASRYVRGHVDSIANASQGYFSRFTSRPVNMAVLYCIKAVESDGGSSPGGVPKGTIVIWSGTAEDIPGGWALCDGQDGRPDLRDKFVLGAGKGHSVGETGGDVEVTLTASQMPKHRHTENLATNINSDLKTGDNAPPYAVAGTTANNQMVPTFYWYNTNYITFSDHISYEGDSRPHNNMPPYYTLCYIIKL